MLRAEDGSLLIESLVACALLAMILMAIYTLSNGTWSLASKDQERAHVMRDAQVGVHRMTRELRQTYNVVSWSATSLQADVLTVSGSSRVTYDCNVAHPTLANTKRCVRTVGTTTEVVVDHVASAVFTYTLSGDTPTPRYVDVMVRVNAKGDVPDGHGHQVEFHDGVYMRNRDG
jgi:hypothetical protein